MTYSEIIASMEFWAGFNPGDIANDATLKETFTHRLNRKLERYLGMLGAVSRLSQIDDTNYSEHPFSLFNIADGQHDYEFLADEDGNIITDITGVLIKVGNAFRKIDKVTLDDKDAELIMSPNDKPGVPTRYLERNNTIFLDPVPNYDLSKGGQLFYKRAPSYFSVSDTTKQPGIPIQFHEMLAIASAYDWLLVHKSNAGVEITRAEMELDKYEKEFKVYNELRSPRRNRLTIRQEKTR